MNVLLDTHAFLWILNGDETVPEKIKGLLGDSSIIKYISAATFWEIAIKVSIGRLDMDYPVEQLPSLAENFSYAILHITEKHAVAVSSLPFHHKDPFDRVLIAQAQIEDLILLTKDFNIAKYDVRVQWQ